ncbi:MAG TPA: thiamine-phosphate kinase [Dehalococcoidia bacterium]|jgi:thiamine-monophosphate kinase|nr:thiamine-phosphate kinase [Dehalococcoidia bacterium]
MKVSELGEFGLIDLLARMVSSSPGSHVSRQQLIIGIGDDATAWHGDASTQLATVDSFIQDVHFSLDTASWEELGWKALAVNMSDIAAMGGMATYALVSLALPDHTEVEDVTAMYRGMVELAQQFGVVIAGGDTSSAPLVAITITVLGNTRNRDTHILTRSGAEPGEKVAVTSYLGTAAAGLEMLTEKLLLDSEAATCLRKAFLRPYPRITEGQLLVEQGVKTAIDISDGLISDLKHICQLSQVGARIEVDRLPIEPMVRANFGDKSLALALSGGEDYELLFTGSAQTIDKVKTAVSCLVTVIGEIIAGETGKVTLVDSKGNPFYLQKVGWEHFTTR